MHEDAWIEALNPLEIAEKYNKVVDYPGPNLSLGLFRELDLCKCRLLKNQTQFNMPSTSVRTFDVNVTDNMGAKPSRPATKN